MEEDNIYEYDDNNWPNKDLRTAAKGKERKGESFTSSPLPSVSFDIISLSFLPSSFNLFTTIHTYIHTIDILS